MPANHSALAHRCEVQKKRSLPAGRGRFTGVIEHFLSEPVCRQAGVTQSEDFIDRLYVGVEEVLYIEAAGNYGGLHLEGAKHLYRITMSELEEQLPPKDFLRIHRTIIVNKRYVKSTRYLSKNEYAFMLKNDIKLVSGRAYREKIDDFFG